MRKHDLASSTKLTSNPKQYCVQSVCKYVCAIGHGSQKHVKYSWVI